MCGLVEVLDDLHCRLCQLETPIRPRQLIAVLLSIETLTLSRRVGHADSYSAVQQDVIDTIVARYKFQATQSAVMRYVCTIAKPILVQRSLKSFALRQSMH